MNDVVEYLNILMNVAKYVFAIKKYYATLEILSKNILVTWLEYATKYSLLLLLLLNVHNTTLLQFWGGWVYFHLV
jgi:hypothetical protein